MAGLWRKRSRALKWILERVEGRAEAGETPIGFVPTPESLTLDGMNIQRAALDELLDVNVADWSREVDEIGVFWINLATPLREAMRAEQTNLAKRLGRVGAAV